MPITHADRVAWQHRAAALLENLLITFPDLPVITWKVGPAGATLTGYCTLGDAARQRSDFEAWCAALGCSRWPEHTGHGMTYLHATGEHPAGVTVGLVTDLCDEDVAVRHDTC